jgi:nitrous oxide reductase accessory protein NosL
MNREQAEATVAKFMHSHGLVSALEALGLLKLDTPESVHKKGVDFIATMAKHAGWQDPDAVADDLAKAGFRIVRDREGAMNRDQANEVHKP